MSRPEDFPDIEMGLRDILVAEFPDELADQGTGSATIYHVNTKAVLPLPSPYFVRVNDITNLDDRITSRHVVNVDVFAPTRDQARDLAERIRTFLLRYPHRSDTVIIDRVVTDSGPASRPWEDVGRHRYGASYQISARR